MFCFFCFLQKSVVDVDSFNGEGRGRRGLSRQELFGFMREALRRESLLGEAGKEVEGWLKRAEP